MAGDDLGTIRGKITLEDGGFTQTADRATGRLNDMQKQVLATALGFVGANSLSAALDTAMRVVKDTMEAYKQLQTRMAEVSTLVDTQKVSMASLEKGVVTLSRRYGQDAGGLAKALYETISAGIGAGDAIKFLDIATKGAIGGVTSTEKVVDALTSTINAYGLSTDKAAEINDSFFQAIVFGKTTMEELSPVIGRIAPVAAAAGVSIDEMNNSIATLTRSGLGTAEAATALQGMLKSIIKPAEDSLAAAKALNIEWGVKGVEAAGGFSKWIQQLNEKTGGSSEIMAKLFPDVEGLNGALILAGEGAFTFSEGMQLMADKAGAADEATKKMAETAQYAQNVAKQFWTDLGRGVGGAATKEVTAVGLRFKMLGEILTGNQRAAMETYETFSKYYDLSFRKQKEVSEAAAALEQKAKDDRAKAFEEFKRQNEERKKAAEERFKKIQAEMEATKGAESEERKRATAQRKAEAEERRAAEEKKQKLQELADLERETTEASYSVVKREIEGEIELVEQRAAKEETTETEKLQLAIAASEKRRELAILEREFQIEMLDAVRARKEADAEDDKELVDKIAEMYEAKLKEIEGDSGQKIGKEVKIQIEAKAKIETPPGTFKELFKQLKDGSADAWQSLVSTGADSINSIGDAFGVMSEDGMRAVSRMGNYIETLISGNPMRVAGASIQLVAEAIGMTGKKSQEAALEQHKAALEAKEAAKAFLKAQGKEDYSLMSKEELGGKLDEVYAAKADYIEKAYGWKISGDQLKSIETGTETERNLALDEAFSANTGFAPEERAYYEKVSPAYSTMNRIRSAILSPEYFRLHTSGRQIQDEIGAANVPETPEETTRFSTAADALKIQQLRNGYSDDWYDVQLLKYANKFRDQLGDLEYEQIKANAAAAQGNVALASTESATASAWNALSPDQREGMLYDIQSASSPQNMAWEALSAAERSQISGVLQINVNVTGETQSAEVVGEALGKHVADYFRGKGY